MSHVAVLGELRATVIKATQILNQSVSISKYKDGKFPSVGKHLITARGHFGNDTPFAIFGYKNTYIINIIRKIKEACKCCVEPRVEPSLLGLPLCRKLEIG